MVLIIIEQLLPHRGCPRIVDVLRDHLDGPILGVGSMEGWRYHWHVDKGCPSASSFPRFTDPVEFAQTC
jgi:hypothetical protein